MVLTYDAVSIGKKNLDIWNIGEKIEEKKHLMNFRAFFSPLLFFKHEK